MKEFQVFVTSYYVDYLELVRSFYFSVVTRVRKRLNIQIEAHFSEEKNLLFCLRTRQMSRCLAETA